MARLLQIGQVAERTGLSLRTIRFYEEAGLVLPTGRSEGGFRLYGEDAVTRLEVVKRMKPLGFTVEEMRELLTLLDELAARPDLPDLRLVPDDGPPRGSRGTVVSGTVDGLARWLAGRSDGAGLRLPDGGSLPTLPPWR